MSPFNQKFLRLSSIICLYIFLLSGSVYILQNKTNNKKISPGTIISNEVKIKNYLNLIFNAQQQYHAVDWDEDGIKSYAQFIAHLWQTVDKNANPVKNNFIPKKLAFAMGKSKSINGYYFQNIHYKEIQNSSIVKDENENKDNNSNLIDMNSKNEWAITAIPSDYNITGMLTFIISSSGKIYAKDITERQITSIPGNFKQTGWQEITNKADISKLHI